MPSRLERQPSFGVVGREVETAALADAYKRVATSAAREVVLITGEAGVGKTVLASQLARTAYEAGACVLLGRCDEDLGVPYGPFVEALGHHVTHAPDEVLRSHVQGHLGATRRARAHRRVAEAIEAIGGDDLEGRVGELAYQWSHATQPVDAAKVISYTRRAADGALAALAPDDAVRYFTQALEFVALQGDADPRLGVDLLLGLGAAQRQAGIAASRETYLEAANRAREIGAIDRLVAAALGNTRGFFSASGVIDTDKVAVLEATLEAIPKEDGAERALLLATLCSEISFGSPFERRRSLADEARAMARRLGDSVTILHVLIHIDDPLQVPSTLDERRADATEARSLAEKLGDPEALYLTGSSSQVNAMQAGDFELATTCLDTMRALSARLRQPTLVWMTAFKEAGAALMAGDAGQAEQIATDAFRIGSDSGQPDAFTIYGSQLMYARSQQGRLGELVPIIDRAVIENPGIPAFRPVLALAHLEAGNDATAHVMLDWAAADRFAWLPLDFAWMMAMSTYAQVAVDLRARGPAQILHDLLVPYCRQVPFIGTLGFSPVSLSLGGLASVLGRYDEAEAHLTQATELTGRGGMKHFASAYATGLGADARRSRWSGRWRPGTVVPGAGTGSGSRRRVPQDRAAGHGRAVAIPLSRRAGRRRCRLRSVPGPVSSWTRTSTWVAISCRMSRTSSSGLPAGSGASQSTCRWPG